MTYLGPLIAAASLQPGDVIIDPSDQRQLVLKVEMSGELAVEITLFNGDIRGLPKNHMVRVKPRAR